MINRSIGLLNVPPSTDLLIGWDTSDTPQQKNDRGLGPKHPTVRATHFEANNIQQPTMFPVCLHQSCQWISSTSAIFGPTQNGPKKCSFHPQKLLFSSLIPPQPSALSCQGVPLEAVTRSNLASRALTRSSRRSTPEIKLDLELPQFLASKVIQSSRGHWLCLKIWGQKPVPSIMICLSKSVMFYFRYTPCSNKLPGGGGL